jgi:hypothetical protein
MAQSEKSNNNNKPKSKPITIPVISKLLSIIVYLIVLNALAGFICLLFEWGLFIYNPEVGYQPALQRYTQITQSITINQTPLFNEQKIATAAQALYTEYINPQKLTDAMSTTFGNIFSKTVKGISESWQPASTAFSNIGESNAGDWISSALYIWYITTLTWVIKIITILAMSVPAVLIVGSGAVDGAVERKINTFKGVRDTEDKHELWFMLMRNFGLLCIFLYLAIPSGYTAYHMMIPYSVVLSVLLHMTIKHYKKYL